MKHAYNIILGVLAGLLLLAALGGVLCMNHYLAQIALVEHMAADIEEQVVVVDSVAPLTLLENESRLVYVWREHEGPQMGMQSGGRLVPYRYRVPRSYALGSLLQDYPDEVEVLGAYSPYGDYDLPFDFPAATDLFSTRVNVSISAICTAAGTLAGMVLLAVRRRYCQRRRVSPYVLYVGAGMLLLTLLGIWNAYWII